MLLSEQAFTSESNLLFLLLINVLLIAVFSLEWETSSSAAFARPRAQRLDVPGIFSSCENEAVFGVQYPGQNHWNPHGSQRPTCWQWGVMSCWLQNTLYVGVYWCQFEVWFLKSHLCEKVSKHTPQNHQAGTSLLWAPKTDAQQSTVLLHHPRQGFLHEEPPHHQNSLNA